MPSEREEREYRHRVCKEMVAEYLAAHPEQPIPAATTCPVCGELSKHKPTCSAQAPTAPNEALYMQREYDKMRTRAEELQADLRDCKRDFRRYAGHYMLCAKKYSDDNACDCGLREATDRWREVGK